MKLNFWAAIAALTAIAVHASTLTPSVLPLIVRNPYLSIWLNHARHEPWHHWPMFWTGSTVGFAIMAKVHHTHTVYPLLGRPQDFIPHESRKHKVAYPKYQGASFDASTTNLTYTIKGTGHKGTDLKITLSFLSPITPTSTFRQSLPAAYLTAYVEGSSDVSIYMDVNGEWVSGHRNKKICGCFDEPVSKHSGAHVKTWRVYRQDEELLTEAWDRAEWGTFHISALADVDHQSGEANHVRQQFARHHSLKNKVDKVHRGIFEDEPIFAFSKSFKLSKHSNHTSPAKDSVRFTFAFTQDTVAQFASARGLTQMRPLWASYFHNTTDLLHYHFHDYDTASSLAGNYSEQLAKDAYASGAQDYQDIVAQSARQVLGATQFAGTPESPIIFLKEISSNGNFQTVDVIYPAFPFFLYTNPQWLAYLLEPLIEHQKSGQYPNAYSMHDLGYHFPNATGHPHGRDEYMPLEECGNMLIMALALANALNEDATLPFSQTAPQEALALAAGPVKRPDTVDAYGMDRSFEDVGTTGGRVAVWWLARSYSLWKQWTGYLIEEALIPAHQLCTDDFAGPLPNQTNLALKGIVGIKAMSEVAALIGEEDDAEYYGLKAEEYIEKWQEYALTKDKSHAKLSYHWYGSWTTLYNMYADALLCFHLPEDASALDHGSTWDAGQVPLRGPKKKKSHFIPNAIYKAQNDWYHAVLQNYGLPMDSRHLYTKSDWEFFAAAVAGKKVRTEILERVARWVNETTTDRPMTDLYETEGTGHFPGPDFMARPVVGGHFAYLALERACGGKAVEGLKFLDEAEPGYINVQQALLADSVELEPEMGEL